MTEGRMARQRIMGESDTRANTERRTLCPEIMHFFHDITDIYSSWLGQRLALIWQNEPEL